MIFAFFKRRRRAKLVALPWPERWESALQVHFEAWLRLPEGTRHVLRGIIAVLVAEKTWEGAQGAEVRETMRVTIAAQAGLLLAGLKKHDYYHNVASIIIYPDSYILRRGADPMGVLGDHAVPVLGHAQYGGPVLLSWKSARHGAQDARPADQRLYHEFAHKLDMLDGLVDGTPPLLSRKKYAAWHRVMTAEYRALRHKTKGRKRGKRPLLDAYGATDVAEFFAVATETFFEKPRSLKRRHSALYSVLRDFYQQDPASWTVS